MHVCVRVCACVRVCKHVFIKEHTGINNEVQDLVIHEVLERKELPLEKASGEAVTLGWFKFQ